VHYKVCVCFGTPRGEAEVQFRQRRGWRQAPHTLNPGTGLEASRREGMQWRMQ